MISRHQYSSVVQNIHTIETLPTYVDKKPLPSASVHHANTSGINRLLYSWLLSSALLRTSIFIPVFYVRVCLTMQSKIIYRILLFASLASYCAAQGELEPAKFTIAMLLVLCCRFFKINIWSFSLYDHRLYRLRYLALIQKSIKREGVTGLGFKMGVQ